MSSPPSRDATHGKLNGFPQRLAITPRRVAWYLNEVTEWMEKRRHQKPVMPLSFLR